jgi:hypothetical protein
MNNKSFIGLVLLVTMVLAKALIPFNVDNENPIQRKSDLAFEVNSDFRSSQEAAILKPSIHLIAVNVPIDYSEFSKRRISYETTSSESKLKENQEQLFALNELGLNAENDLIEEVLPLEAYSNTGYGLWKKPQEKIKSFNDRPGEIPLDNGNTISDNISKLFPRTN